MFSTCQIASCKVWRCCEVVTTLTEVNGMRHRQEGSIHRSDNREDGQSGLHKNTSHAYSQDVLSFMLEKEGESVHTGNTKRSK